MKNSAYFNTAQRSVKPLSGAFNTINCAEYLSGRTENHNAHL